MVERWVHVLLPRGPARFDRTWLPGIVWSAVALAACSAGNEQTGSDTTVQGAATADGGVSPLDGSANTSEYDASAVYMPGVVDGGDDSPEMVEDENCGALTARVRDFKDTHPDFETYTNNVVTPGIVRSALGADHKPVYADVVAPKKQTTSAADFDQWYRDVPGVNEPLDIDLPLTENNNGLFVYDSDMLSPPGFFPLDGKGFGNQGREHNYHFTTELHTKFTYHGGEIFKFTGDDDLWLFVNGKLALDLGGLHPPVAGTVNFDQQAEMLGITVGETYAMDIFHAERHTVLSNFRIETSIDCFMPVVLK